MGSVSAPASPIVPFNGTRAMWRVLLAVWLAFALAVPQVDASAPPPTDARSHTHIDVVSATDALVATVAAKQSHDWSAAVTWVCAGNPFAFATPRLRSRLLERVDSSSRLPTRSILQLAARPPPHN